MSITQEYGQDDFDLWLSNALRQPLSEEKYYQIVWERILREVDKSRRKKSKNPQKYLHILWQTIMDLTARFKLFPTNLDGK